MEALVRCSVKVLILIGCLFPGWKQVGSKCLRVRITKPSRGEEMAEGLGLLSRVDESLGGREGAKPCEPALVGSKATSKMVTCSEVGCCVESLE